jgi:Domain of unknown function (DUF4148)
MNMNAKYLIAAGAFIAATGSAFAQQTEFVAPDANFVSTKTRADVKQELNQAKASGAYAAAGSEEYAGQFAALKRGNGVQTQVAAKSRAEVIGELKQAEASGNFVVGGREYAGQHIASTWPRRNAQHLQFAGK